MSINQFALQTAIYTKLSTDNNLTTTLGASVFDDIPEEKQQILVNMAFNLGVAGLMNFKNMLSAVEEGRWSDASTEMLDSKWADQVGTRAIELSGAMAE